MLESGPPAGAAKSKGFLIPEAKIKKGRLKALGYSG
jgi:hypothetical protein